MRKRRREEKGWMDKGKEEEADLPSNFSLLVDLLLLLFSSPLRSGRCGRHR